MNFDELREPVVSGAVSTVISLVITYGYHLGISSSGDIGWALVSVAFASFFSAFFSLYDR